VATLWAGLLPGLRLHVEVRYDAALSRDLARLASGAVLAPTGEETSPVVAEPIRGARRCSGSVLPRIAGPPAHLEAHARAREARRPCGKRSHVDRKRSADLRAGRARRIGQDEIVATVAAMRPLAG
jgi:hypothetical protein